MDSRHEPDQEERALDALVAAALERQRAEGTDLGADLADLGALEASKQDLTEADRAALEARTSGLIEAAVRRGATAGRGAVPRAHRPLTSFRSRPGSPGASRQINVELKGVRIMKSLALSVAVVVFLTVAIVVGTSDDGTPPAPAGGAFDAGVRAALEQRLEGIEARLDALGDVEDKVAHLETRLAGEFSLERASSGRRGPVVGPHGSAAAGAKKSTAATASSDGAGDLRDYIVQVIDDVREERAAARQQRAEERRREMLALHEGPYGDHNFRVNSMARRLGFSEDQTRTYYLHVVEYNNLIGLSREREAADKENRDRYREERKRIRTEFSQVIAASLAPEQAEIFSSLPERAQHPDGSSYMGVSTIRLTTPDVGFSGELPVFDDFLAAPEAEMRIEAGAGEAVMDSWRAITATDPEAAKQLELQKVAKEQAARAEAEARRREEAAKRQAGAEAEN